MVLTFGEIMKKELEDAGNGIGGITFLIPNH